MLDFLSAEFLDLLEPVRQTDPIYIYLILFGMAFMENIFPPLPGDTFTILGGYLAASGKLSVSVTLTVVSLGTLFSVMLIYAFGYRHGRDYFIRKRFKLFNAHDILRVERWFYRFGIWTLLFSRFVVGARVGIAIGAGMVKYKPWRMTLLSLASAVIFHGTLIILTYAMYAYITQLVEGFNIYGKIILVIVALLVIFWGIVFIRRIRHGKNKA